VRSIAAAAPDVRSGDEEDRHLGHLSSPRIILTSIATEDLFSSGSPTDPVVGWLYQEVDETHDEAASQGWAPFIIDTMATAR